MPTRMIREGLLDSERYWSCTIEARELFTHLILLADDFGCLSLSPALIGRRCFDQRPTSEKLAKLITQLCDADLIRQYQEGKLFFAFIPRFGQRLRRFTLKHPRPPEAVLFGDERAINLFNRINKNNQAMPDECPSDDGHTAAEEKGREVEGKRKEVEERRPVDKSPKPPSQENVKTDGNTIQGKPYDQWRREFGIEIQNGWGSADVKLAVEEELAKRST